MKCEICGKEKTKSHHFEIEINQLLQQYKDQQVKTPWFKDGTFDFLLLSCHVGRDDMIHIHEERHWDGRIIEKEFCKFITEDRAKYIISKLKNYLKRMLILRELKQEYQDIYAITAEILSHNKYFSHGYISIPDNLWTHIRHNALGDYYPDEQLTLKQLEKIKEYCETARKARNNAER